MQRNGSRIGSRKLVSTGKVKVCGKSVSSVKPKTEFIILIERLKEAAKLKASSRYHDRDFDKLVDAL